MIAAIFDVILHPLAGTIRATRRWPASACHLRALLALIVLGVVCSGGCWLYFRVSAFDVGLELTVAARSVEVSYVLPILAGCGLAGAMVLLGGAFVRVVASSEWKRSIDENQYVRLMAAAMWALVPVAVGAIALGATVGAVLDRPEVVLVVLPVALAIGFAVLARLVVRRLYRVRTGDPVCDRCGYLLRGLTSARCPECGEPFPAEWITAEGDQAATPEGLP
jgi:hypothetical protein